MTTTTNYIVRPGPLRRAIREIFDVNVANQTARCFEPLAQAVIDMPQYKRMAFVPDAQPGATQRYFETLDHGSRQMGERVAYDPTATLATPEAQTAYLASLRRDWEALTHQLAARVSLNIRRIHAALLATNADDDLRTGSDAVVTRHETQAVCMTLSYLVAYIIVSGIRAKAQHDRAMKTLAWKHVDAPLNAVLFAVRTLAPIEPIRIKRKKATAEAAVITTDRSTSASMVTDDDATATAAKPAKPTPKPNPKKRRRVDPAPLE